MRSSPYRLLLSLTIIVVASASNATEVPHFECFQKASVRYQIDINLLLAIAAVESEYDINATNVNRNGSTDYGVMQINSRWKEMLAQMGIDWYEVKSNACLNIHVGAWVLATNFAKSGISWYSVGAYNAGFGSSDRTRKNRLRYSLKVHKALEGIQKGISNGHVNESTAVRT